MIRNFNFDYEEGQVVYLKTDIQQFPRMVTGYLVRGNTILYELSFSNEQLSYHAAIEISDTINDEIYQEDVD